jgi:hypothetical protein
MQNNTPYKEDREEFLLSQDFWKDLENSLISEEIKDWAEGCVFINSLIHRELVEYEGIKENLNNTQIQMHDLSKNIASTHHTSKEDLKLVHSRVYNHMDILEHKTSDLSSVIDETYTLLKNYEGYYQLQKELNILKEILQKA